METWRKIFRSRFVDSKQTRHRVQNATATLIQSPVHGPEGLTGGIHCDISKLKPGPRQDSNFVFSADHNYSTYALSKIVEMKVTAEIWRRFAFKTEIYLGIKREEGGHSPLPPVTGIIFYISFLWRSCCYFLLWSWTARPVPYNCRSVMVRNSDML